MKTAEVFLSVLINAWIIIVIVCEMSSFESSHIINTFLPLVSRSLLLSIFPFTWSVHAIHTLPLGHLYIIAMSKVALTSLSLSFYLITTVKLFTAVFPLTILYFSLLLYFVRPSYCSYASTVSHLNILLSSWGMFVFVVLRRVLMFWNYMS
jgi:hypothetical protein